MCVQLPHSQDQQLLSQTFQKVRGGVFFFLGGGVFPPRIIAGILPWEPRLAGRCIAAGSRPPAGPRQRRPPHQSSARSDQKLSGRSPGSRGSGGILSYPNLSREKKRKEKWNRMKQRNLFFILERIP